MKKLSSDLVFFGIIPFLVIISLASYNGAFDAHPVIDTLSKLSPIALLALYLIKKIIGSYIKSTIKHEHDIALEELKSEFASNLEREKNQLSTSREYLKVRIEAHKKFDQIYREMFNSGGEECLEWDDVAILVYWSIRSTLKELKKLGKRIKWLILPLHESETDRHLIGLSG